MSGRWLYGEKKELAVRGKKGLRSLTRLVGCTTNRAADKLAAAAAVVLSQ